MTSAFVPFQSAPTTTVTPPTPPSLLSPPPPPLAFFGQHPSSNSTKLPSVFAPSVCRRTDGCHDADLPSYGYSLPPLQTVIPPPAEEIFPAVVNRKGSIASILNSDLTPCQQLVESRFPPPPPMMASSSSTSSSSSSEEDDESGSCLKPRTTKKRKCPDPSPPVPPVKRGGTCRREDATAPSRASKGLRHFSKKVCDKVAEKGVTTYNEVADELAKDIRAAAGAEGNENKRSFDQKNIRRRVYDALNVLMAMGIIAKDKKQIKWLGIPSDLQQRQPNQETRVQELQKQVEQEERRKAQLTCSLEQTRTMIRDKVAQHLQVCNLIWRNQHSHPVPDEHKVSLPFFVLACPEEDELNVQLAKDGREAEISCATDSDRLVYEDADVLRSLGLNRLSHDQIAAWLPDPSYQSFLSTRPAGPDGTICIQSNALVSS